MSIDFENITTKQLRAMSNSQRLEYAWHWQIMQEKGVQLEWLDDDQWKPITGSILYTFILYRMKPRPIMVPLDFGDYLDINLQWILDTRTNEQCFISSMDTELKLYVKYQSDSHWITFTDLQTYFTWLDGSRFEKPKE